MKHANVDQLANQVVGELNTQPGSARRTPVVYRTLLQLLARGRPVTIATLARAVDRPDAEIQQTIATWADTEYDEQGRIVGYGLTLRPTPHRFTVDGRQLYAWCALDTLFFPKVIGQPAEVQSPCRGTGQPIRLTVEPSVGVTGLDPATAMVSIVTVDDGDGGNGSVRTSFCDGVHFFATTEAATAWRAEHPGTTVLPVDDAYRLAQPLADTLLDPELT